MRFGDGWPYWCAFNSEGNPIPRTHAQCPTKEAAKKTCASLLGWDVAMLDRLGFQVLEVQPIRAMHNVLQA